MDGYLKGVIASREGVEQRQVIQCNTITSTGEAAADHDEEASPSRHDTNWKNASCRNCKPAEPLLQSKKDGDDAREHP